MVWEILQGWNHVIARIYWLIRKTAVLLVPGKQREALLCGHVPLPTKRLTDLSGWADTADLEAVEPKTFLWNIWWLHRNTVSNGKKIHGKCATEHHRPCSAGPQRKSQRLLGGATLSRRTLRCNKFANHFPLQPPYFCSPNSASLLTSCWRSPHEAGAGRSGWDLPTPFMVTTRAGGHKAPRG